VESWSLVYSAIRRTRISDNYREGTGWRNIIAYLSKYKIVLHTTPLQLLLTKDVVKDIPSAIGYPAFSTRCLNQ
jgi:hypothetical protein